MSCGKVRRKLTARKDITAFTTIVISGLDPGIHHGR
jgi:hypothetical protein